MARKDVYGFLQNDLQRAIFRSLSESETGGSENKAYSLTREGGRSSYSFGWVQWDLPSNGQRTLIVSDNGSDIITYL